MNPKGFWRHRSGVPFPPTKQSYGYIQWNITRTARTKTGRWLRWDLAAAMLASTLGIDFDVDEKLGWEKRNIKISSKIVRTLNVTQSTICKDNKYTHSYCPWLYLCSDILSFATKRNIHRETQPAGFSSGYGLLNISRDMNKTIREKKIPELKMRTSASRIALNLYYEGRNSANSFCSCHRFFALALASDNRGNIVTPNQAWVPYICNYRECDPEKGGLAWGLLPRNLSGFCRSQQQFANHLAVGHSMGATVLPIAAAVFGMEPRAMDSNWARFPAGRNFTRWKSVVKRSSIGFQVDKKNKSLEKMKSKPGLFKIKIAFFRLGWGSLALYLKYGMEKNKTQGD